MSRTRFSRFALALLLYTVPVILWGAFVRASHSGDGCGAHWPLCNGQILPTDVPHKTWVEFGHRVSSGLLLPMVLAMLVWAHFAFERGHAVRRAAMATLLLTLTEGYIGAFLVKKELVAGNATLSRALYMSLHLVNTFALLAALALMAYWAWGFSAPKLRGQGKVGWLVGAGVFAMMLVGISGAVAALGDTLYPAETLRAALAQDFDPMASLLVRHRLWHPVISICGAIFLTYLSIYLMARRPDPTVKKLGGLIIGVVGFQMIVGLTNVLLLAPIPMQIFHLLVADILWVALIGMSAAAIGENVPHIVPEAKKAREVKAWQKKPSLQ